MARIRSLSLDRADAPAYETTIEALYQGIGRARGRPSGQGRGQGRAQGVIPTREYDRSMSPEPPVKPK